MKKGSKILLFITGLLIISCMGNDANNKKLMNETQIPNKYIGEYFNRKDSTYLTISKNLIIRNAKYQFSSTNFDKSDSIFKFIESRGIRNFRGQTPATFPGMLMWINVSDTIFNLTKKDSLKRYKEYYFLNPDNKKQTDTLLSVYLNNGLLTINRINKNKVYQLKPEEYKDSVFKFTNMYKPGKSIALFKGLTSKEVLIKIK